MHLQGRIVCADVLTALRDMPDNSFDGVFCDPPYELGFMGKSWDSTGIAFCQETWAEVLRVCKPGAHLLAFGGSRTFHRLVCAVEDAGWEVRDVLMYLYGSGFPKSMDVSKAIDKAAGVKPVGVMPAHGVGFIRPNGDWNVCKNRLIMPAPATDAARQWDGYGTALKPAYEPVVLARKPLDGTVAQNVQQWGCGALWIDGGRIGTEDKLGGGHSSKGQQMTGGWERPWMSDPAAVAANAERSKLAVAKAEELGRFPANVLHGGLQEEWARYFYCAKASQKERNAGCEALPAKEASEVTGRLPGSPGLVMNGGKANPYAGITGAVRRNIHPTVKPLDLCRYLATLILPPAGRPQGPRKLLVPFSGSGSEMTGALLAGWDDVTGIEREAEYVEIAKARLAYWTTPKMKMASTQQLSMFAHLGVSQ